MIDHVSIAVGDLARATQFYDAVLGTIEFRKIDVRPRTVGFGKRYSEFWINHRPGLSPRSGDDGAHVCVRAASPAAVDAFFAAALRSGGSSDGEPGLRPDFGPGYYAAFIRDPDGNRIEAVTFIRSTT